MRIADLLHGLEPRPSVDLDGLSRPDPAILAITEDSRAVAPGSLFIARRGTRSDGRTFIKAALEAGAVAVLTDDPTLTLPAPSAGRPVAVLLFTDDLEKAAADLAERFYGNPSSKLAVVGVTGTKGKTTTTFLIHQMLNALGVRSGLIGTVHVDDGASVTPATLTTPPALEVSRLLSKMIGSGCRACIMEVSSHSLHQRRVGAIGFRAGVFTNLSGDHLDYHGTMESYGAAKAMLFASLPADGVAVVNIGDPAHSKMVEGCKARVLRCALDEPLAVRGGGSAGHTLCTARVLSPNRGSTDVEFVGPWGRQPCRVPLVGGFNILNALEAVATVHALFGGTGEDDFSFAIIAEALARCSPPPGRLELVTDDDSPFTVLVDYAHTDDALRNVLSTLREAQRRRGPGRPGSIWCVFGCGGDRDRTKRPRMGLVAAELADRVLVTSDNPRTEDPAAIIAEILAGVPPGAASRVGVEPDRERAIHGVIAGAEPGDCIIIAGKGHEAYQILPDPLRPGQTVTRDFDDRKVAAAALLARGVAPRRGLSPA